MTKKAPQIEAPPTRHSYARGIDETLKAQQLQDLLKVNPNIRVNLKAKAGERKGFTDTPLFKQETQTNLF